MGGGARRASGGAPRRRSARLLPALPRVRPSLPPAPAQRARGADPRRQVAHREQRVGAPVLRAHLGDHRRPRRCRREPRAGTLAAACRPTARCGAPRPRRSPSASRPGCARVRSCSTRCSSTSRSTTGCGSYPNWFASRNLANEASDESVQALVDAVQSPLRHPAAVVRAQGAAARARPARRLRPHGVGRELRRGVRLERGPRARARRVRVVLARAGVGGGAVLRRVVDRRADASGQASRRVLRVHRAAASTRTCCSTGPRAAATCSPSPTRWVTGCTRTSRASRASSTRPRRSPSPRPRRCSARRSPSGACSTPPTTRPRASRCSPRASKVRSPPCSARSR